MEKAGFSQNEEPVGTLLTEHTIGRVLVGAVSDAIEKCDRGDPEGIEDLLVNARGVCSLLSKHICCEDAHLFVEAETKLSEAQMSKIALEFKKWDEQPQEIENNANCLQLITELEAIYLTCEQESEDDEASEESTG